MLPTFCKHHSHLWTGVLSIKAAVVRYVSNIVPQDSSLDKQICRSTFRCGGTFSDLFDFIDTTLDGCQGLPFQSRPGWCPERLHRCRVLALVPVLCKAIYLCEQISPLFFLPFPLLKNSANIISLLELCFVHVTSGALLLGKAWPVIIYSQTEL